MVLLAAVQTAKCFADEFCVITAEHGYIVDEDDEILETLRPMSVVDLLSESTIWLRVRSSEGTEGWIRTEQVHRSSMFADITKNNAPQIRNVLAIAASAAQSSEDRNWESAITQYEASLKKLEDDLGTDNTGYAWLLTYLAGAQRENNDVEGAERGLNRAETILKAIDETKSLHAADLFNEKANLAHRNSDMGSSVANYQQALLITSSKLGLGHSDIRVISSNLASVCSDRDETQLAIETQRRVEEISTTILPTDAAERAKDGWVLGQYHMHASEIEAARAELLEAKRLLDDNESAAVDLADISFSKIATKKRSIRPAKQSPPLSNSERTRASASTPFVLTKFNFMGCWQPAIKNWVTTKKRPSMRNWQRS